MSGPNSFQLNPASSIFIFPRVVIASCSATFELPVNYVILNISCSNKCYMTSPVQLIKSTSVGDIPHSIISLMNYSMTILTLLSPLRHTLLPDKSAPTNYNTGISKGKLKGAMILTGPKGKRCPLLCCPSWSPATENPFNRNRLLSPLKFSKKFLVTTTSALAYK